MVMRFIVNRMMSRFFGMKSELPLMCMLGFIRSTYVDNNMSDIFQLKPEMIPRISFIEYFVS